MPGSFHQTYEDSRDADEAVKEMNGKSLDGQRIVVEHAGIL